MTITHLTSAQLHGAIFCGCQNIVNQKSILNQINVFPVADGDTGDNMASTAKAIMHFSAIKSSINETLQSIADASVIGARGNSGIIFSQFFNALAEKALPDKSINANDFYKMISYGAQSVQAAMSTPMEGTMLTIIKTWAQTLGDYIAKSQIFTEIMAWLLPILNETVNRTATMLPALKKVNLVDAGALGFYYFVQGFTEFLENPHRKFEKETAHIETPLVHSPQGVCEHPNFRYCTEAVLKGQGIDKISLTERLEQAGDCALVTGNDRFCRFHVHTNEPHKIFTSLLNDYTIQYPKVDDIVRQFEVNYERHHSIALVTDTSADLPLEKIDAYQIHQVPINIHLDEHHLLDRYSIESNEFYQSLKTLSHYPKTSCPSSPLIEERLRFLSEHYEHVLVIALSGAMSGTYDAFLKASRSFNNIKVFDSNTASGAHGLLVDYAGELIASNTPIDEIMSKLEAAKKSTFLVAMISKFDSLIRSGRISKFTGKLAGFSRVKPIIAVNDRGVLEITSKMFSLDHALHKLVSWVNEKVQENAQPVVKYCIVHSVAPENAELLAEMTTQTFNQPPSYSMPISVAVGLHAGPGCVGIGVRLAN